MTGYARKRKLTNIRLTAKFHVIHMGIWMVISVLMVSLLNCLLYLLISQQMSFMEDALGAPGDGAMSLRLWLGVGLAVEAVVFAAALVLLAMNTSHRVAGPHIRLKRTCEEIRDGNRDLRLKFRDYDLLDDMAESFNRMVDELCPERKEQGKP